MNRDGADRKGWTMQHDALDQWAEWMAAIGSSPKTILVRTQGIQALARHAGVADPARVSTRQVVAWLARDMSPWTRQTYWYTVQAWGTWLVENGHRDGNPAERIPKPTSPTSLPRPVSADVIARMLDHPRSTRAYAYTVLAVFAGLRVHEIAKIRGDDVHGGWLYVNGKGGRDAAIPAHNRIRVLAAGMPPAGYWFRGADHGHVNSRSVSLTLTAAIRAAGATGSAHALRHSYGTKLLRQSRDLRVTQTLMRHRSVATTERYTEVAGRDLQAAIVRLDWGGQQAA